MRILAVQHRSWLCAKNAATFSGHDDQKMSITSCSLPHNSANGARQARILSVCCGSSSWKPKTYRQTNLRPGRLRAVSWQISLLRRFMSTRSTCPSIDRLKASTESQGLPAHVVQAAAQVAQQLCQPLHQFIRKMQRQRQTGAARQQSQDGAETLRGSISVTSRIRFGVGLVVQISSRTHMNDLPRPR